MFTPEQARRVGFLQSLCNQFGDFKVAIAGQNIWSKHKSVLECWEKEDFWFLANSNNRQILPCEIVLDLDDNPSQERFNEICSLLERAGEHYKGYFTGSRSYHIHIWSKQFATWKQSQRETARQLLLGIAGADLMKKSERTMIALEGAPHFKTGKPKELLRKYPLWEE